VTADPHDASRSWNALDALAVVGAAVLAVAVARMPILTPDVWWHLATGRLILADGIPRTDPFSWTVGGADWFLHEWLADVVSMRVVASSGLLGLVTFRSLLIVAAFGLAYRLARRHAGSLLCLLLLVPAAWATHRNWLDRPQLWTFVLLPLLVSLLETARQDAVPRRVLVLVPMLMLAWANLHGAFMIGLAVTIVWMLGALAQQRLQPVSPVTPGSSGSARRWLLLVLMAVAATLATPNGIDGLLYPLRYVGSGLSESLIEERVGHLDSGYAWIHLVFVAGLLAMFVLRARRLIWSHALLGVLLAVLSMPRLGSVELPFAAERHAPLFLLVGVPLLCWQVHAALARRALPGSDASRSRLAWGVTGALALVAVLVAILQWPRDGSPEARLLPGRYPVRATAWIQNTTLPERLLNPYRWGGWLLYHLYPQHTVSIDSRGDLYGIERIRESQLLQRMPPGSQAQVERILERDQVDLVVWPLLTLDFGPLQLTPLADYLLQSPAWRLIYWDPPDRRHPDHPAGTTGVFLRQHPRNEAVLQQHPAARLPRLPGPRRSFGFPPSR
jgi:hypothetical protein